MDKSDTFRALKYRINCETCSQPCAWAGYKDFDDSLVCEKWRNGGMNKQNTWKALKEPHNKECSNCKFDDEPAHNRCLNCGRMFEPPLIGYLKAMDEIFEDNWEWDNVSK